jgi:uncharacterized membrane protein YebE (DUF533 family)
MKIDNVIDNSEVEFIEKQVEALEVDGKIKKDIMNNIYSTRFIQVDFKIIKQSKIDVINLINNLVLLAKKDGNVHKTERMFIEEIANSLDFPLTDLDDMFKS